MGDIHHSFAIVIGQLRFLHETTGPLDDVVHHTSFAGNGGFLMTSMQGIGMIDIQGAFRMINMHNALARGTTMVEPLVNVVDGVDWFDSDRTPYRNELW